MALKIYTKTGDLGKTSLIGGTKVPKSHLRIESYGTIDELNSYIGLVSDQVTEESIKIILKEIQDRLFTIGSSLACDPDKEPRMKLPDLKETDIVLLENEIDKMNESLPPMKSFILPGGTYYSVYYSHSKMCMQACGKALCKYARA
jgi:cob(I)alamin adenosyltransferase